jgi:alpha-aminoadipic semialdehyde synthase
MNTIGLRLEDKNEWERRVALIPAAVADLTAGGIEIRVERFARRAFGDAEYEAAGATLVDDVRDCDLVLGIKEMPVAYFRERGAYVYFSHTIKGQPYNMAMLQAMVDNHCTLIDYETVTNDKDQRLIFFGRYAGLAGMIDTLWTLGRRLEVQGHVTAFLDVKPAHAYDDLDAARAAVTAVGERIAAEGLPQAIRPAVFGFTGYGNVSQGAQEILDLLPHVEVDPDDLAAFVAGNAALADKIVKVVYKEQHLVRHKDPTHEFDLQDYYDNGADYVSIFEPHHQLLTVLINCIYWDERYAKLADADQLAQLFAGEALPRLIAIGDITCDVDGSLACTVRDTEPGDPVFIYDPNSREARSGFDGPGLAVMAVGNLPTELPREASMTFSEALAPYMPELARADLDAGFDDVELPAPIKRATILWHGRFTPDYRYMIDFLR